MQSSPKPASTSTASKRKTRTTESKSNKKAKVTDENADPAVAGGVPAADLDKVAIIHYNVSKVQASIAAINLQTAKENATSREQELAIEIERGLNLKRILEIQKMLDQSLNTKADIIQVLEVAFGREQTKAPAAEAHIGTNGGVAAVAGPSGLVGGAMFMPPGAGMQYMMPYMMNGPNGPMWMNPQGK